MTSIKSTHEKLYAIYIEWAKLSEIENHSLFIWLLYAVETIIMRLCIKLVHVDHMLENEWLSHFCYDSSYASMLIAMLMTMLMTMFLTIVDRSSLDYQVVSKSTLFRVSLCSSESYR